MTIAQDLRLPDGREVTVYAEGWPNADREGAAFYYTEGNGACDCSLADAVRAQVDRTFPFFKCGQAITLLRLRINGEDIPL